MEKPITDQEQNFQVASASMHDVSLSNNEPEEQAPGSIEKIPSKSSSLKRFFKLNSSKKSVADGGNEKNSEDGGAEADNEDVSSTPEQKTESVGNQDPPKGVSEDIRRSRSRRFNFRFHGSTAENDTPTSSGQMSNASRHSLRGSLSTYFNSVFKRKQNASPKNTLCSPKKMETGTEDKEQEQKTISEDISEDIEATESQIAELVDELHTMTISEQSPESASAVPLSPVTPKALPTNINYPYN